MRAFAARLARPPAQFAMIATCLGLVALAAPEPWYGTDRAKYEEVGREIIIEHCASIHCSRILVPAIIEHLPGPSLLKWKLYAVLANSAAAVVVGQLALVLGLSAGILPNVVYAA